MLVAHLSKLTTHTKMAVDNAGVLTSIREAVSLRPSTLGKGRRRKKGVTHSTCATCNKSWALHTKPFVKRWDAQFHPTNASAERGRSNPDKVRMR